MLSIENFCWILFDNLLKPLGLDCWYYYPFGTQNNLSMMGEFQPWKPKQESHVLFHYDQEPIWTDSFPYYDSLSPAWSNKLVRILANSEHSETKQAVCRQRGMLDWYFFFHGFAALDWFRDGEFIQLDATPNKIFCSLNHQARHTRAYRMAITARLFDVGVIQFGDISFHAGRQEITAEINDHWSPLTEHEKNLVSRSLLSRHHWPLVLDRTKIDGDASAHFGHQEFALMQNSLVHLVNETVFYESKLHLTEKIFKPIVALRPFVLAAAPGNLAYIKRYGFQTFDAWWDESYDEVEDPQARSDMIVDIITKLCAKSNTELQRMHQEMKPVLEHNKKHFFGEFRKIIVHELVDNFDRCIRLWNNGRVDGRELALHPDLESIKQILLR